MSYTFAESIRQAMKDARRETLDLQHDCVGTEQLLLGVLPDREAAEVLLALGISPDAVRTAVLTRVARGSASTRDRNLPDTFPAKKVLEFAMAEADEANTLVVDSRCLLLGILREEHGLGAEVLAAFGATLEKMRAVAWKGESRDNTDFRVQIDDASDLSIYEQIINQITEAIATGALRPGVRLPTVRKMADDLDVAPGTVARSYSELESRGLVITEGARGTWIAEPRAAPTDDLDRHGTLAGLLRPVAVAAFHLGSNANELRSALESAMRGIFDKRDEALRLPN